MGTKVRRTRRRSPTRCRSRTQRLIAASRTRDRRATSASYHRPPGWRDHRWGYGEILPRAYWAPQYLIADYWLFSLEVPPMGYEWVRDGNDALLIDTNTGAILQVEYGVFA